MRSPLNTIRLWIDSGAAEDPVPADANRIDRLRVLPFVALHAACLGIIWVGWSWTALIVAVAGYLVRMFAITGFYHRYFSHKSFQTGRVTQFVFAVLGNSAAQRGPLWWAAHHRRHHQYSDTTEDVHSPRQHGFWWSHVLWFLTPRNFRTDLSAVRDLAKYPELRFLDRYDIVAPALYFALLYLMGEVLRAYVPALGTSGWQLLVWGGAISTVIVFHATCCINSLAHRLGRARYATGDDSRNSLLLALLTLGEGWHNNHHSYAVSCRQSHYWWEIDITYYILRLFGRLGLVWAIRPVPVEVRHRNLLEKTR